MHSHVSSRIGAQLWIERDASVAELDDLVQAARTSGLGLLRVFLIWPWIEAEPGTWEFGIYDHVFDIADRHGLGIKATLTPDTPPWHLGGAGFVQSSHLELPTTGADRAAAQRYLVHCVERYRRHPALRQWLLWNEPFNSAQPPSVLGRGRTAARTHWIEKVRARFADDIAALNRRWLTGYPDFDTVPYPEKIAHPAHRGGPFFSFDPWLAEAELRADLLAEELGWVNEVIKSVDPDTPTCINPPDLFRNHAALGYDFGQLTQTADVLGASVHAPWHLGFARRTRHLSHAVSSVRMLAELTDGGSIELTEVQSGNVLHGSPDPWPMPPHTLAAWYLAPLIAGAQTVTGWSLNSRSRDFEAGDWGLLDDENSVSTRSLATSRVAAVLEQLDTHLGTGWAPQPVQAVVAFDERSEAVSLVHSWTGRDRPGRAPDDAIQGVAEITAILTRLGVIAAPTSLTALRRRTERPDLIVLSHLGAADRPDLDVIIEQVAQGATLLVDGTCAQKDLGATVYRPWPGGLADAFGYRVLGMISAPSGHRVQLCGAAAGILPLGYADLELTEPHWQPDHNVLLADQAHRPLVWSRSFGSGRVVLFAGALGPALVHDPELGSVADYLFTSVVRPPITGVASLSPDTVALRVRGTAGELIAVFGPAAADRSGQDLRIDLPPGCYRDLWQDGDVRSQPGGTRLTCSDGISLLHRLN